MADHVAFGIALVVAHHRQRKLAHSGLIINHQAAQSNVGAGSAMAVDSVDGRQRAFGHLIGSHHTDFVLLHLFCQIDSVRPAVGRDKMGVDTRRLALKEGHQRVA